MGIHCPFCGKEMEHLKGQVYHCPLCDRTWAVYLDEYGEVAATLHLYTEIDETHREKEKEHQQ